MHAPDNAIPLVAIALGGPAAQKITGERDPLPQLRETILALNTGNDDEIPVVATFDLAQLATKSKEKALLWQDLLLAKSILQNT
jgi:DNA polymerase